MTDQTFPSELYSDNHPVTFAALCQILDPLVAGFRRQAREVRSLAGAHARPRQRSAQAVVTKSLPRARWDHDAGSWQPSAGAQQIGELMRQQSPVQRLRWCHQTGDWLPV